MSSDSQVTASAAEVIRNFGLWQNRANEAAVHITHHGRRRLVMLSAADYDALQTAAAREHHAVDPLFMAERVMAYSDDGFFLVDEHLETRAINASGCSLLKTSTQEFVGKPLAELVPGLVEDVSFEMARRALQSGQSAQFRVSSPRYEGRVLEFRAIPVHGCVACVFRDVTGVEEERQDAGRLTALREAMDLLHQVAQARLSPRGTFVELSPALPTLLGLPPQRLIGVRFVDVLMLGERARIGGLIEEVLLSGATRRAQTALLANGGAGVPIEVAFAPVRVGEEITGVMIVLADCAEPEAEQAMPRVRRG